MAAQASQGPDRLPVNCGVKVSRDKCVLAYQVGKNVDKKNILWEWQPQGDNQFVATLEAKTKNGDIKYHKSAAIDADMLSKLGEPEKSTDDLKDGIFKVKLKIKSSDVGDLEKIFDVPQ